MPTYVELESTSELNLKSVIDKLGLEMRNAIHGSVEAVYTDQYDVIEEQVLALESITFTDPPKHFQHR